MTSATEDAFELWSWPISAFRLKWATAETLVAAHRVIAARTPIVAAALQDPLAADSAELNRMIAEKPAALRRSGRAVEVTSVAVRRAAATNAAAARGLARTGWLAPVFLWSLQEANLAAAAALLRLPLLALAPVRHRVLTNERRLGRRAGAA